MFGLGSPRRLAPPLPLLLLLRWCPWPRLHSIDCLVASLLPSFIRSPPSTIRLRPPTSPAPSLPTTLLPVPSHHQHQHHQPNHNLLANQSSQTRSISPLFNTSFFVRHEHSTKNTTPPILCSTNKLITCSLSLSLARISSSNVYHIACSFWLQ